MKSRFALAVAALVASASFATAQTFTNLSPSVISPFAFTGGTGTFANPYVLDETFIADGDAYIGVRGFDGNGWFRKDVTNNTSSPMTSFEVEIGFGFGFGSGNNFFTGSDDGDGYSFAQGNSGRVTNPVPFGPGIIGDNGTFSSTKFGRIFIDETTNTRDFIQYFGGVPGIVNPGESVSFVFQLTTPANQPFVIRQQANVAVVPEPATMLVLGAGLAALAARRRNKKA